MIPGVARPLRFRADESIKGFAERLSRPWRQRAQAGGEAASSRESATPQRPTARDFLRRHPCSVGPLPPIRLPLRLDRAAVLSLKLVPEGPASLELQAADLCRRWMLEAPLRDRYAYKQEVLQRLRREDAAALEDMAQSGASENSQALEAARQKSVLSKVLPLVRQYAAETSRHTFSKRNCVLYMVARLAPNYASGVRVLYELRKRWPDYRPKTLFDFGSGLGTSAWAANTVWPGQLREHFMVDPCAHMNSLASLLMQDGSPLRPACFPGVYLRQFLPSATERRYDLVTCAHSLLAIEDSDLRTATLDSLWAKVEPGGVLVVMEHGNRAGFAAVAEARRFLLDNHGLADAHTGLVPPEDGAHIVAPCPHAFACPRLGKRCAFTVNYAQFRLSSATPPEIFTESFAYLIVSKGAPPDHGLPAWPRVVEPGTSARRDSAGQALVGLCLPSGSSGCFGFAPAHTDPDLMLCAKLAQLGDRLPAVYDAEGDTQPELLPEPEGEGEGEGEAGAGVVKRATEVAVSGQAVRGRRRARAGQR